MTPRDTSPLTRACSERALERGREEPDAVHPAAARGGDHRGQEAQDTQDHQLDQAGSQCTVIQDTQDHQLDQAGSQYIVIQNTQDHQLDQAGSQYTVIQETHDHQLDQAGSQYTVIHYTRHTGSSTGSSR